MNTFDSFSSISLFDINNKLRKDRLERMAQDVDGERTRKKKKERKI